MKTYYANVYDGVSAIMALVRLHADPNDPEMLALATRSMLRKAHYEHGLPTPDYEVLQTPKAAFAALVASGREVPADALR